MTCTCAPGATCLLCAELESDPNPFRFVGALGASSIEARGRRAYGAMWPDARARMLRDHSGGRAEFTRALYIAEGLALLAEMETAHPEAFAMPRQWKDPDRWKPKHQEKKKRGAWFPAVPDSDWVGIPSPPRVVSIAQPHDLRVDATPFSDPHPGDLESYRQYLARQILGGAIPHALLVEIGRRNGWDGVRLGARPEDHHAATVARSIDAALRYTDRQFLFLIKRHFTNGG